MALQFIDGFDHYDTARVGLKWDSVVTNVTAPTILPTGGRNGGGGLSLAPGANTSFPNSHVAKAVAGNLDTSIAGCAWKLSSLGSTNYSTIVAFRNASGSHVEIRHYPDGTLKAYNGTTLLGTASGTYAAGTFRYLEAKLKVHGSTGTVDLQVDGISVLALTAQNTAGNATLTVTEVRFNFSTQSLNAGATLTIDDVYLADTTGTLNNAFLGDVRVTALYPNGAGANAGWTPSAGANYQAVDETTPNDDTDFVATAAVNTVDSYALTDLPATVSSIKGVAVNLSMRKDDAGARTVGAVVKSGATTSVGAGRSPAMSYASYQTIFETDPATAAAWTLAALNAAEAGAKLLT